MAGGKNAVENNNLTQITTQITAQQVRQSTVAMLGVDGQTKNANEQMALALEQTLKSIADFPVDLYNSLSGVKREDVINNFLAELTPTEIEAIKQQTKITYEKNQVVMGNRPKAENFDSYLASNDYGKELSGKLTLVGTDAKGNPIYQAAGSGYGNYIWSDSFVTMDAGKDTLLVYNKNGSFQAALNLDGTKNDYLTNSHKEIGTVLLPPLINPIPDPLPQLPGLTPPENLVPNNTGHGDGLDNVEIKHDTGGNQIPEAIPALPGYEAPDNEWQNNFYISENGDPAFKNGYIWKPDHDIDLRGTDSSFQDALDEAFNKTGYDRSKFKPVRWSKTADGKSIPVQYKGPNGAEVNVDVGHEGKSVGVSHIGYQVGTKGKVTGHILVDDVPANRYPGQPLEK